jgi:hypothetical protein
VDPFEARCRLQHLGGSEQLCELVLVEARTDGIATLWPNYVHPGSAVTIMGGTKEHGGPMVEGVVGSCLHVQERMHCVDIRGPMLGLYREVLSASAWRKITGEPGVAAEDPLCGKVVVRTTNDLMYQLLVLEFSQQKASLQLVRDSGAVLDACGREQCDIAILDLDDDEQMPLDMFQQMRVRGLKGPILIASSDSEAHMLTHQDPDRFCSAVGLPYLEGEIVKAARDLYDEFPERLPGAGVLVTTRRELVSRGGILEQYIEAVRSQVEVLGRLLEKGNCDAAKRVLTDLGSTATSYGFEPLADATLAVQRGMDSEKTGGASIGLQRLQEVAERLSAD